jgi:hypothetical protein
MKIRIAESLPLSAEAVFHLLRDDMGSLVPHLPDVRSITVTERHEEDDRVRLVNLWQLSTDKVPGPVRKMVKPEILSWNDHAAWTTSRQAAEWRLEPRIGARVFECSGSTLLLEDGAQSRIEMHIDAVIYPERVPGVPKILARRFFPQIEGIIEHALSANMQNLPNAIRAWAAANR